MKTNFGTQLSRDEMKNVVGGYKWQIVCICSGGNHSGDAIICGANTTTGAMNCTLQITSYCFEGGGHADCNEGRT
jgi:hypothetical protein